MTATAGVREPDHRVVDLPEPDKSENACTVRVINLCQPARIFNPRTFLCGYSTLSYHDNGSVESAEDGGICEN